MNLYVSRICVQEKFDCKNGHDFLLFAEYFIQGCFQDFQNPEKVTIIRI